MSPFLVIYSLYLKYISKIYTFNLQLKDLTEPLLDSVDNLAAVALILSFQRDIKFLF